MGSLGVWGASVLLLGCSVKGCFVFGSDVLLVGFLLLIYTVIDGVLRSRLITTGVIVASLVYAQFHEEFACLREQCLTLGKLFYGVGYFLFDGYVLYKFLEAALFKKILAGYSVCLEGRSFLWRLFFLERGVFFAGGRSEGRMFVA